MSWMCASISPAVIPLAYMDRIFSSMSWLMLVWFFFSICGSNSPFRSRGIPCPDKRARGVLRRDIFLAFQHLRAHRRGGRIAGQQVAVRELDFQRREILRRIRLCECHLETSQMALAGHSTFKEEQNEHQ